MQEVGSDESFCPWKVQTVSLEACCRLGVRHEAFMDAIAKAYAPMPDMFLSTEGRPLGSFVFFGCLVSFPGVHHKESALQ